VPEIKAMRGDGKKPSKAAAGPTGWRP